MSVGGFESARAWVEQEKAAPTDFRFFTRYCGWRVPASQTCMPLPRLVAPPPCCAAQRKLYH